MLPSPRSSGAINFLLKLFCAVNLICHHLW